LVTNIDLAEKKIEKHWHSFHQYFMLSFLLENYLAFNICVAGNSGNQAFPEMPSIPVIA